MDAKKESLLKIKNLAEKDGGRELVKNLDKEIGYLVNKLTAIYREATHIELLSTIAEIEAKDSLKRELETACERYEEYKEE